MTEQTPGGDPALTIAVAMGAGILVQSIARHARIPGIVMLLGAGVLLGPDVMGIVQPASLGDTLYTLVGMAVAVILFEGGLNLNLKRLRREARSIRQLVTIGALVTGLGGTLAARLILDWDWRLSILFGTLVIVTGPTVITPLVRRIGVTRKVATVLEAEGVFIDAIGAIIAAIAIQLAVGPSAEAFAEAPLLLLERLGLGLVAGVGGGLIIAWLLRVERLVPEGLENVFTLSLALVLFEACNHFSSESGLMAVTVAGLVVGNVQTRVLGDLKEFKEQLTVLLIGMLFVLLAADVRVADMQNLGWPGVWTVLALMFVVRPLNVLLGTVGSDLSVREKLFLCWLAPRGIVAAAVASLFAQTLMRNGIDGGPELRALVFLVILGTVLVQGLSGGIVARLLGVRRERNSGYAFCGANALARALGRVLTESGNQEVVFLESNPDACSDAEKEGFRVIFGNGLGESLLQRAGIDSRAACCGLTPNDAMNLVFARKGREEYRLPRAWVALQRGHRSVTERMVDEIGARVLFGGPSNLDLWIMRLERGTASIEIWHKNGQAGTQATGSAIPDVDNDLLVLAVRRGRRVMPMDSSVSFKSGDHLFVLVFAERRVQAIDWLERQGWSPVAAE